jgi:outer membrane scaffolding protein for murein synthesis (MipA/OmpV family)
MNRYSLRGRSSKPAKAAAKLSESRIILRKLVYLVLVLGALGPGLAWSQTPSPLQEWQYSGGIALAQLFEPKQPEWRVITGLAAEAEPVYSGARATRIYGGPVFNIRYKDIAFLSAGEGLGYNFLRGRYYRVGVSVGYDSGRREADEYDHLRGLGNISIAPTVKLFGSYVLSKSFPMVVQADIRQIIGGADGTVGDLEAYMPLPGSSKGFVMFLGPSITWANHSYLQKVYGVSQGQSLASGDPIFNVHGGTNSWGLGFSATKFFTQHWLLNVDAAYSRLRGSAAESPITESRVQRGLAFSLVYRFGEQAW